MKQWILAAVAMTFAGAPVAAQTVKIGTFHQTAVVVAYYRSPQWAYILGGKRAQLETAKWSGDTKKVQELETWGQTQQDTAHKQLEGEASIDNIIEALKPALPEIAAKAGVDAIVPDLPYAGSRVQTVDVTDLLLDWLKADARTRDIVRQLPAIRH